MVSEFPISMPPSRQNFPRRNRIVAGLCEATIVVEAGTESGAMITARHAIDYNREVFALPGNVDNPVARGCNALIKEGATLIERFEDVTCALGEDSLFTLDEEQKGSTPAPSPEEGLVKRIWELLGEGEAGFEEIQAALNVETGELLTALMKLELKMLIELTPEQRYRRMA